MVNFETAHFFFYYETTSWLLILIKGKTKLIRIRLINSYIVKLKVLVHDMDGQ